MESVYFVRVKSGNEMVFQELDYLIILILLIMVV